MEPDDTFLDAFLDACFAGELPKTQEALASGRLTTDDLSEGLALATHMAHPEVVAALFDAGASVSPWTVDSLPGGDEVLQHLSVVRHFLDHGLDPNSRCSNGEPVLSLLNNPACACELLLRGADPNLTNLRGITPLVRAIVSTYEADTSLPELLLAHGAKLESDLLFTALGPRVRQGELMTRFLLAKGLDPNMTSVEWGTPLHRAVYSYKPNLVKLLLEAGADPTAQSAGTQFCGKTPLQAAETLRHSNERQAILSLLQSWQAHDSPSFLTTEYYYSKSCGRALKEGEAMASLDEVFANATENGSILGVVILGRDTSGKFNYSKAFGRRTFGDGEESLMGTDTVLSFASATKLITCIAVMQLVEAGKLNLDDDAWPIIPELAEQEVLLGFDETTGEPQMRKRTNPLKLRYLLTHSAGLAYVERFAYPLAYEPGTGWGYSPGIDWAGKIVERVTGETLESYFQKHIFEPLDITSITFWPHKHPSIQAKLATMTARTASGGVEPYKGPYITDGAEDCFGGQGASGNLEDYMKILTSLLVNDGKLLRKETADQFFQPQLTAESKAAQKALFQDPEKLKLFIGDFPSDVEYDWGLGGILVQSEGRTRRFKGTMIWSGMPNLFWFIDRARGLCGVIGMQLLPPADPKAQELVRLFEEGMYELLGNQVV
ncbi:hypothetical protein CNMCM6805_010069 [Aspergillus fumigatiaffinis]|uniref:Beta-lactamase-related domain-containing protein n=1 Tax=Aspergillus fumigatiaffinis TaxID=340414 RepID=A0A8H4H0Y4_9EURO|nr:hypothetical protein CNMCM6805_010069 [Aspergillus fumigatiaffinis]